MRGVLPPAVRPPSDEQFLEYKQAQRLKLRVGGKRGLAFRAELEVALVQAAVWCHRGTKAETGCRANA